MFNVWYINMLIEEVIEYGCKLNLCKGSANYVFEWIKWTHLATN